MNAPLLWIISPLLISGLMLLILNRPWMLKWLGTATALIYSAAAWLLPVGREFRLLFWNLRISEELLVFGRRFILGEVDQALVALLFTISCFWFFILEPADVPPQLIPLGLISTSLILAGFAVEPIFYGALFFAFLALVLVILLSPPGEPSTPGVYRFLIYQLLGVIFVLFASWLGSWIDFDTSQQQLFFRAAVLLGLGFSFLLGLFPFSSWISMVAERNHPFSAAYVFNIYLLGGFIFALRFLNEPGWLQGTLTLREPMQLAGMVMVGLGAVTAVFSNHLGRIMAAAVFVEVGRSLAALSLPGSGTLLYFSFLIIQMLALGVWGLSLTLLRSVVVDMRLSSLAGAGRQWPILSFGVLVGLFTLAGLPFLGGFPHYWSFSSQLTENGLWLPAWYFIGSFGLIVSGLRSFSWLARKSGEEKVFQVGNLLSHVIILGISLLLLTVGLFPGVIVSWASRVAAVF